MSLRKLRKSAGVRGVYKVAQANANQLISCRLDLSRISKYKMFDLATRISVPLLIKVIVAKLQIFKKIFRGRAIDLKFRNAINITYA